VIDKGIIIVVWNIIARTTTTITIGIILKDLTKVRRKGGTFLTLEIILMNLVEPFEEADHRLRGSAGNLISDRITTAQKVTPLQERTTQDIVARVEVSTGKKGNTRNDNANEITEMKVGTVNIRSVESIDEKGRKEGQIMKKIIRLVVLILERLEILIYRI
jgi:inosine-uridine nucleoside N-ribohydrolase